MQTRVGWFAVVAMLVALACCGGDASTRLDDDDPAAAAREAELRALLGLPDRAELPYIPFGNPPSAAKIELGRRLFYERRLSGNGTQACADCHLQALAFSDGKALPVGSTGETLTRNSQGLANVAYAASLTWASDGLLTLEQQIHIPLTNDNPVELGLTDGVRDSVLASLGEDPSYAQAFASAFSDGAVTLERVIFALATFCRTMVSRGSAYDRYLAGDASALTSEQKLGADLFFGERFECFHCHNGSLFTGSYRDARDEEPRLSFFNNGLYNVGGDGSYPRYDQGLYDLTGNPEHRGLFRPPSLRNVALTAPYMHDGTIATLRGVVEHYVAGGRLVADGPYAGDGRASPLKSGLVRPFDASPAEIDAVVAFLDALTDLEFVSDSRFAAPE